MSTVTGWLLLYVGCAECAGGEDQLIAEAHLFPTDDAAKAHAEEQNRADGTTYTAHDQTGEPFEVRRYPDWKPRDGGGWWAHTPSGGWEIIPMPDVEAGS